MGETSNIEILIFIISQLLENLANLEEIRLQNLASIGMALKAQQNLGQTPLFG